MDLDALKEDVRHRLGDLTEVQLPDTQISRAVDAALRVYSRFRKRSTPVMLNINPNQYEYPLSVGTTAVGDIFAYPSWLFWENVDPLMLSIKLPTLTTLGLMTLIGIKPIDNWPRDYQVLPPDATASPPVTTPTLRLLTLPDVPAIMFLLEKRPLVLAELAEEEQERLIKYVQGDCLFWIGMRRSKPVKRVPTATGAITLDDGRELRMEGQALMDQFRRELGVGATVLDAG